MSDPNKIPRSADDDYSPEIVEQRQQFIASLSPDHITMLTHDWGIWARDNQWPPEGAWRVWLIMPPQKKAASHGG